jgi:CheY-like chemotaxis protein
VFSPPTILITDDDTAFRETLQSGFAPRGFHTLLACDGDEALDIVRRQAVHVLLTDMHMPRMTGLEVIRRMRHDHLLLPCILITGRMDEGLLEEAGGVEDLSILRKPVRFREVWGAVLKALEVTYGWSDGEGKTFPAE